MDFPVKNTLQPIYYKTGKPTAMERNMYEYSLNIEDLPNEIWKDVNDYEGIYKISNIGRMKRINAIKECDNRILKGSTQGEWYKGINLHKDGGG